ncbi:MAG TPA: hypothetical protein VMF31_07905 [Solirubrobacterales bacterium]|nr:hypothetical protein [Solirubrobacterales bacterium]
MRNGTRNLLGSIPILCLLALVIAAPTQAAAKAPANGIYTAKTENGGKFTFKLAGRKITRINGTVPVICVETTGSSQSRAGAELFQPPGGFTLGKGKKTKALQPAALDGGVEVTKNYDVLIKGNGPKLKGKVKLNYSFLTPGPDIYSSYVWICAGSVSLTAKKG